MGASRDKKMRRLAADTAAPAASKKTEEKTSGYMKKVIAIVVAVAIVAALVLVFNSSLLYRHGAAVSVGGTDYSVAEFNYFYNSAYNALYQQYYTLYGNNASRYMPDTTKSLSTQYVDEENGTTWADYIESMTLMRMNNMTMLCKNAEAEGFELSESSAKRIDESLETLPEAARSFGVRTVKAYLEYIYGKGMNVDILRKCSRMEALATEYSAYRADLYEFSDEEMDTYYDENLAEDNDYITYRRFFFSGSSSDGTNAKGTMLDAKEKAVEFQSRVTDEQSFIDLAYEYAEDDVKSTYEDPGATLSGGYGASLTSSYYTDWLKEAERKPGDCVVLPDPEEENTLDGYYVIYYVDRDSNDYPSVNYTYMYVPVATVSRDSFDSDEAYYKAVTDATAGAASAANEIGDSWKADNSDENLAALRTQYASSISDTGNGKRDGKYDMSAKISEWLFDESRQVGEVTVIDSDYGSGYYIIRFDGTDILRSRALAKSELGSEAFAQWQEENSAGYKSTLKGLIKLTKKIPAMGG